MTAETYKRIIENSLETSQEFSDFLSSPHAPPSPITEICAVLTSPLCTEEPEEIKAIWLKLQRQR